MVPREFLEILSVDALKTLVSNFDIHVEGDKRRRDVLISEISDSDMDLDDLFSVAPKQTLIAWCEMCGLKSNGSAQVLKERLVAYFEEEHDNDEDNYEDEYIEQDDGSFTVYTAEEKKKVQKLMNDIHDQQLKTFIKGTQIVESVGVENIAPAKFDAYWFFLRMPGQLILWWQYYFPSKGQLWASARRKDNEIVEVLFSIAFWAVLVFVIGLVIRESVR